MSFENSMKNTNDVVQSSREIHYWNFLKAFSIFLVVYCHMPLLNPTWHNNYSQLITYVAVPLFFMVNGAALFSGKFNSKKHLKKIFHLFLVSRVWRIFYLLFALQYAMIDRSVLTFRKFILYFGGASIKGVPAGPLWFIRVLIACYLLFPILKAAFDSEEFRKYLWVLCLAILILMLGRQEVLLWQEAFVRQGFISKDTVISLDFLNRYNPINEWAVLYFVSGGLLHQRFYAKREQKRIEHIIGYGVVFVMGSLWLFVLKGLISGFSGTAFNDFSKYGVDGCYQSVAVLSMAIGVFMAAMYLPFRQEWLNVILRLIGRNTLVIYYMHYVGAHLLKAYVPYFGTHVGIICNSIKTVVVITGCMLIGFAMKKIPVIKRLVV